MKLRTTNAILQLWRFFLWPQKNLKKRFLEFLWSENLDSHPKPLILLYYLKVSFFLSLCFHLDLFFKNVHFLLDESFLVC